MAITINGSTGISGVDGSAGTPALQGGDSDTGVFFPAANTIAFAEGGAEAARIDSSGKLRVGTGSDYAKNVQAAFYGAGNGGIALASGTSGLSRLMFADATAGNAGAYVGSIIYSHADDSLRFNVNGGTERMRIADDGQTYWGAQNPGTADFGTSFGRSGNLGFFENFRNTTSTGTVAIIGGTVGNVYIRGDGDLENTNNRYTGISDIKFKQNIEDAGSQWDDIKGIRVRKYEFIANPDRKHIGVVAQELEEVCPGLVIERIHDEETGETAKSVAYSVLYMKAVKALQEAMERIETLETEMAAVKAALDAATTTEEVTS